MATVEENRKTALYALLDIGVEIESDEILEIVNNALNGSQVTTGNDERVAGGKRLFEEMFDKDIDENQLSLFIDHEKSL